MCHFPHILSRPHQDFISFENLSIEDVPKYKSKYYTKSSHTYPMSIKKVEPFDKILLILADFLGVLF